MNNRYPDYYINADVASRITKKAIYIPDWIFRLIREKAQEGFNKIDLHSLSQDHIKTLIELGYNVTEDSGITISW